jgi:hypothetical protein
MMIRVHTSEGGMAPWLCGQYIARRLGKLKGVEETCDVGSLVGREAGWMERKHLGLCRRLGHD